VEQQKLTVTVPEAADMVSISRSMAYALVAKGEWPSISVGRAIRVPVEAVRAWVERRLASACDDDTAPR
jgi:excisionase family DNA binding protein